VWSRSVRTDADVLAWLFPVVCPICDRPGGAPCPSCAAELRRATPPPVPRGVDAIAALLRYDDGAARLIGALKYRDRRAAVPWLASAMAALVTCPDDAVVTWAPTATARRRGRGFDQAELLARALASRWRRPCRALLSREPGPPQTGRDALARRAPAGFRVQTRAPRSVLLVDDVMTTGATLTAAASALRAGGAQQVIALTAARTPLKVTLRTADHCA
jgi:ComF family protein